MTTREFFIKRFKAERPAFVNVIRALPNEKLDYKPHERKLTAYLRPMGGKIPSTYGPTADTK
jgi:hypothetical protein